MSVRSVPRVLVTGASGFIGRRVTERFAHDGYSVVAVSRSPGLSQPPSVKVAVVPEISGETSWRRLLQNVEVVIHCAAHVPVFREHPQHTNARYQQVNVEGTRALAEQAAEAGVRRFIFLSSIKVHGDSTEPGHPFSERSPFSPSDAYGRSKHGAESQLARIAEMTPMSSVILRPPLVYGPGAKGNLSVLLRWVRRGIPLPLGMVHENRRSLIALDNLVDAVRHCVDHPNASGQTFVVSDGDDLSTANLIRAIGRAVGRPSHLVPVPPQLLRAAAAAMGQTGTAMRLLDSLQVDASKISSATGWRPPLCVDEGLRRMASITVD